MAPQDTAPKVPPPSADIQAILTVLGRRRSKSERSARQQELDLSYTNLHWANLCGANLSAPDLGGAYLEGADLGGANLDMANLSRANLSGADLRKSKRLTQEQIDTAEGDSSTKLPKGLHVPESWKEEAATLTH